VHPNTKMDKVRSDTMIPMVAYLQILRILFIEFLNFIKGSNKKNLECKALHKRRTLLSSKMFSSFVLHCKDLRINNYFYAKKREADHELFS